MVALIFKFSHSGAAGDYFTQARYLTCHNERRTETIESVSSDFIIDFDVDGIFPDMNLLPQKIKFMPTYFRTRQIFQ